MAYNFLGHQHAQSSQLIQRKVGSEHSTVEARHVERRIPLPTLVVDFNDGRIHVHRLSRERYVWGAQCCTRKKRSIAATGVEVSRSNGRTAAVKISERHTLPEHHTINRHSNCQSARSDVPRWQRRFTSHISDSSKDSGCRTPHFALTIKIKSIPNWTHLGHLVTKSEGIIQCACYKSDELGEKLLQQWSAIKQREFCLESKRAWCFVWLHVNKIECIHTHERRTYLEKVSLLQKRCF